MLVLVGYANLRTPIAKLLTVVSPEQKRHLLFFALCGKIEAYAESGNAVRSHGGVPCGRMIQTVVPRAMMYSETVNSPSCNARAACTIMGPIIFMKIITRFDGATKEIPDDRRVVQSDRSWMLRRSHRHDPDFVLPSHTSPPAWTCVGGFTYANTSTWRNTVSTRRVASRMFASNEWVCLVTCKAW